MRFVRFLLLCGILVLTYPTTAQDNSSVTIHVVQRGENLFRIAQRYGVTVNDLAVMNGIVNPGNIKVGQRILVPNGELPEIPAPQSHTVQAGETLQSIANFFEVPIQDLISLNEISNPSAIYVGQVLTIVPDNTEAITPTAIPTEAPPATASAPASVIPPTVVASEQITASDESVSLDEAESMRNLVHTVQYGETLYRIAQQYGLTVNDMVAANRIADARFIYVGQQLIVPGFEIPEMALDLPALFSGISVVPTAMMEGKTTRMQVQTNAPAVLSGTFLERELRIASDQAHTDHVILQGIPLFTAPGIYPVRLRATQIGSGVATDFEMFVQVVAGPYGREYIQLMAGRDGLLDPSIEDAEQGLIESVMSQFTETRYFDGPMGLPAAATVISPFGTRRSYNGGPFDRFHSGTDFAGASGTPVLATAPGQVVLVDSLNVRGLATIIDHGWGIYTGYWHQSQQYVQVGDLVEAGQVIGTVGSTGRVTGAHLHWELWVGGVPVDPMEWVRTTFN